MRSLLLFVATVHLIGCSGAPDVGESCVIEAECPAGTGCFGVDGSGLRLCLLPCDPASTVLCTDETEGGVGVCIDLEEGGACFTGGGVAVGEPCMSTTECELGALCVIEGSEGRCRAACDLGSPACAVGTSCQSLGSGIRGYCAPD
jgi:hypothetical protein